MRSKECPAELRDRIVLRQIWGRLQKTLCCVEGSHEHLASMKQSGLFLDLASWPNWAIKGEGSWLERWSRHWWPLWLSSMILYGDGRNILMTNITSTNLGLMAKWPNSSFSSVKIHETLIGIYKNTLKITLRLWKKKRFSGLMNLNSLFMSEGNQASLITCIIPSQRWSMVEAASCSGNCSPMGG